MGKATVIAEGFRGSDLVVAHDGKMFVTNPGPKGAAEQVWYVGPKGDKKIVDTETQTRQRDRSLPRPVASLRRRHPDAARVYSYQVQPDGTFADRQAALTSICTCPTPPMRAVPTGCA